MRIVLFAPSYLQTDSELATAVANVLKWHTAVMEDKIKIMVEKGVVSLSGECVTGGRYSQ